MRENDAEAVWGAGEQLSRTCSVKLKMVPGVYAFAVPEIVQVFEVLPVQNESPSGREPPVSDQLYGAVPPPMIVEAEYGAQFEMLSRALFNPVKGTGQVVGTKVMPKFERVMV